MADRDDKNIKHFQSRSQQPKFGKPQTPIAPVQQSPNVNLFLVFDDTFGPKNIAEVDDLRFRAYGTLPSWTGYQTSCAKKTGYNVMKSSFEY